MLIFLKRTQNDRRLLMLSMCGNQLRFVEYLSTKYEWRFVLVSKQNDSEKDRSTCKSYDHDHKWAVLVMA